MIRSLLVNRTIQVVSADNKISTQHTLSAGVPQGSILAPFLFLIYIHDMLSDIPSNVCMSLFADDIAMLPSTPGVDGLAPLQRALSVMTRYASQWKITFSAKKTNTVYFHPDRKGKDELWLSASVICCLLGQVCQYVCIVGDVFVWGLYVQCNICERMKGKRGSGWVRDMTKEESGSSVGCRCIHR